MRKVMIMLATVLMFSIADANAQGFLKKLKQKAQQAVGITEKEHREDEEADDGAPADPSNIAVAQGSDIVPKRRTVTVTWDGTITPSKASTVPALMAEFPQLPSAEKMARSTMEERDAYTQQIAAVLTRSEQLQEGANGCSDAEMETLRQKWEQKLQNLFGLTKEEMAILSDEDAPESKKDPIRQKLIMKIMGGNPDQTEIQRFEKMSDKEQEAYIRQHPEFIQKMQKMALNAGNFSNQAKRMSEAINSYEAKVGKLMLDYVNFMELEESHSYAGIVKKYDGKLQRIYGQVCATSDAVQIDALYAEADDMLYNYRLEAAKEYRTSLQRRINQTKKFAAEFARMSQEVVNNGDLPECVIGRNDLNAVIMIGNLLDEAYKDLPELEASPVCKETVYELQKGWTFVAWECGGYIGAVSDFKTPGSQWPLLVKSDETEEFAVIENGKFRKIDEDELKAINNKADARRKKVAGQGTPPPYGVYKSRSGKRMVEYSKTGEVIIDGMTTFTPSAFTVNTECLEWIIFDGGKIVKCSYKM